MIHLFKVYLATGFTMAVVDAVWLGLIVGKYYHPRLDTVSRQNTGKPFSPTWTATILVYVILVLGIMIFVLPKVDGAPLWGVITGGALYGLIVYGVYDLTNYSTLKGMSMNLVLIDIAWGVVLCSVTTLAAGWFNQFFS